jgi:NAD+ diphosphatase
MFRPENGPARDDLDGLHVVFQHAQIVTDMRAPEPCLIPQAQILAAGWGHSQRQFMGYWHDQPCYALEIDGTVELDPMRYQRGSLYQVLGRIGDELFALAGRASQLLAWERDHRFCGRCGNTMQADMSERAMRCAPCGVINYPRISPCIIVLVTRGEELLLARNVNFPRPMYSTLAGFIEAGESAEETLVREVREEVGVEVGKLRYFGSQSWPFPSQLMLGYFAEYAGGDIVCEEKEIADAQWFHYRELPPIPPPTSISGQLIQSYLQSLS